MIFFTIAFYVNSKYILLAFLFFLLDCREKNHFVIKESQIYVLKIIMIIIIMIIIIEVLLLLLIITIIIIVIIIITIIIIIIIMIIIIIIIEMMGKNMIDFTSVSNIHDVWSQFFKPLC